MDKAKEQKIIEEMFYSWDEWQDLERHCDFKEWVEAGKESRPICSILLSWYEYKAKHEAMGFIIAGYLKA